jgi:nicotinamide mononucleotide transporter
MIKDLFSVDSIFFTVLGYPMSYIEFFGTIFNIWSVYLVAKNKILNWPVGIIGTVLFMILFFQIQLYSDFIEQIYYLVTAFYGWWIWWYLGSEKANKKELKITKSSRKTLMLNLLFIIIGTAAMGYLMSNIHIYFPKIFIEPASYPYMDAFTTVMSFAATFLLIYRKIEAWIIWIVVDVIGIGLYFVKDVKFISLLYLIFLFMAINGLITWRRLYAKNE